MLDASRSVGVVEKLINPRGPRRSSTRRTASCRSSWSRSYAQRQAVELVPYAEAQGQAVRDRLGDDRHSATSFLGESVTRQSAVEVESRSAAPLAELAPLHRLVAVLPDLGAEGQVPAHLRRPERRRGGRTDCSTTPASCSTASSTRSCSQRRGVYGFWPAASDGDDIVVYADETRDQGARRASTACASSGAARGRTSFYSLADFVAPVGRAAAQDYHRRLRRHRRPRLRRAGRASSTPTTTTTTRS